MDHLTLNVYLHDWGEQQELVTGALAPTLRSLRDAAMLRRAWFGRFDARGPHVYVLVSTPAGEAERARRTLADAVDAWLAAHPALETLDDETVRTRHAECRGKRLCALDDGPGFEAPGTYTFATGDARVYPLYVFPEDEAVWALLTEHALANAAGVPEGQSASAAGLRWLAAVDHALADAGADAAEYWRHHAGTLLPGMAERLSADEAAVLDALPRTIGERNLAAMDRVWAAVGAGEGGEAAERARRLVRALLAGREPAAAWRLLRETNHGGLLQLGVPVRSHVPAVLYAWNRALRPATA
ncbi:MAG TPA: lantibiotic dehydratase C-terminal domain-containing protein [Longimicrobium sp.]|nr:lantibiotic dehydratase C-terminal domain-containing protein [Longimicrobium sp.]